LALHKASTSSSRFRAPTIAVKVEIKKGLPTWQIWWIMLLFSGGGMVVVVPRRGLALLARGALDLVVPPRAAGGSSFDGPRAFFFFTTGSSSGRSSVCASFRDLLLLMAVVRAVVAIFVLLLLLRVFMMAIGPSVCFMIWYRCWKIGGERKMNESGRAVTHAPAPKVSSLGHRFISVLRPEVCNEPQLWNNHTQMGPPKSFLSNCRPYYEPIPAPGQYSSHPSIHPRSMEENESK
jgi:hypothetical protein